MSTEKPDPNAAAKELVEDPILRQVLWLVKNGIPFDVAHALDAHELTAYTIIFGEFEGGKFNWSSGKWEPRD